MIIVYRANDVTEAHIVKGMLESYGIEAFVQGYYLQGAIGELPVSGLVSVAVHNEDETEARDVIKQYESGASHADEE
jgi:hypothetical protein